MSAEAKPEAEVYRLSGEQIYTPEQREDVIKALREWLERAEAGEVTGVAIAALYRDGSVGRSRAGERSITLLAETFMLAHVMADSLR